MSTDLERSTSWLYEGVWGVLTGVFRVPRTPPSLPTAPDEKLDQFRPAPGYLAYRKFFYFLAMVPFTTLVTVLWIALTAANVQLGMIAAPFGIFLIVAAGVVFWTALHLRYDTIWYVLGPRSMRLRRGIWVVKDITLTYENVQNVNITQGPLQRIFGISNLRVDTAGGGTTNPEQGQALSEHAGVIEGVDNPMEIRALILGRLQEARGAGLGDDMDQDTPARWTPAHLEALRDIRDTLRLRADGTSQPG